MRVSITRRLCKVGRFLSKQGALASKFKLVGWLDASHGLKQFITGHCRCPALCTEEETQDDKHTIGILMSSSPSPTYSKFGRRSLNDDLRNNSSA
eukprot:1155949-Pelagomonas_calceolata.AAC.4